MKRKELVNEIADKTGMTKKEADKFVGAFVETVMETLAAGDNVQIVGFGSFDVSERNGRVGRNPHTGELIEIKASKFPRFRAGKAFRDVVK